MAKLIIGCGYLGRRLARHWLDAGEVVFATTRNEERADEFQEEGMRPVLFDVTQPSNELPAAETVVFAVGFDRSTGHSIQEVYVDGLRSTLDCLTNDVRRFIYISSTGVYGQTDGGWVDESSACAPNRDGGKACLAAEHLLRERLGDKVTVLRLAGIYGPDRLPQVATLKRAEPLKVAADAYLNLIHVDDAVRIVAACDSVETPPHLLCVSDGQPILRGDFYGYLAKLINAKPPVFEPPAEGSSRAERARGSKRISNAKLIETLASKFLFPTYKEGLRSIVE